MLKPTSLKTGNKVIIVATARKINSNNINLAIKLIESWGLIVELGKNLFKEENQFAGNDVDRISDFQEAIDNDEIKAIFCARGGYGTVRIIDNLNFDKFKTNPKWIIGYSDITVLHNHLNNMNITTLHATMPINFPTDLKDNIALQTMKSILFGEKIKYEIDNHCLNRNGTAEGIVVGGNLSVIYSLMGSNSQLDTINKILFIEDIDEYLYHIDRMMLCLKRAGMLKNLKALLVGAFTDMKDNTIPFGKTAEEIIYEAVAEYDYPICFNFPAGHIEENKAILYGNTYKIEVNKEFSLFENS